MCFILLMCFILKDSVEGADDDEKPKAKKSYAPAR